MDRLKRAVSHTKTEQGKAKKKILMDRLKRAVSHTKTEQGKAKKKKFDHARSHTKRGKDQRRKGNAKNNIPPRFAVWDLGQDYVFGFVGLLSFDFKC
jgi:hypothetical protein